MQLERRRVAQRGHLQHQAFRATATAATGVALALIDKGA